MDSWALTFVRVTQVGGASEPLNRSIFNDLRFICSVPHVVRSVFSNRETGSTFAETRTHRGE